MTQLEALKVAAEALEWKVAHNPSGKAQHYWGGALQQIVALTAEVEALEADPGKRAAMAEAEMAAAGRYVTFWVSREWLIDQLVDEDIDATDEILDAAAKHIMASQDIGTSEAALIALLEWAEDFKAGVV